MAINCRFIRAGLIPAAHPRETLLPVPVASDRTGDRKKSDMIRLRTLTGCALLLVCAAIAPGYALELNAPGVSVDVGNGGASATVGAGGTSAGATVGGSGSVDVDVNVGTGVGGTADAVTDTIGDAIEGAPGAGAVPDDNAGLGTDAEIIAAFQSLAPPEQAALRERCSTILGNPISFTDALVAICRLIADTTP